ncbi:unnamed protein product [Ixodes hexagonus]
MTTNLFKSTGNVMNPPARLRNTNADPFRFAAITLSVFGIHIEDPTLQSDTMFFKVLKISLSVLSIVMANVFFLQHVVCYVHGLDSWVHTKWLTAALVSAVTSTLVIIKGTRIRHVAAFYRTNFLPWRSRSKTVAKTKSTATILVIWAFILINCVDYATNGTVESEKIYSYFSGPPENGTFQSGSSPLAVGFLRLDGLIRWFFVLAFPLYCVYVGITMAAAGFHEATMDVLSQFEAFMAIVGKRYQLQFPTFFLAHMCVSSMGLNPPRLTVCRLFTIRRLLLALLVLFYIAFVTVMLRFVRAGDPV